MPVCVPSATRETTAPPGSRCDTISSVGFPGQCGIPGRSGIVFAVDRGKLNTLADTGQARATFSAGLLTLPSLRYGNQVLTNVRLDLTSREQLEFTVRDFSR